MEFEKIKISERAANAVKAGYLWIFSNDIVHKPPESTRGQWCEFFSQDKFIGTGYFNSHSLIAGRVVSLAPVQDAEVLLRQRLQFSLERRRPLDKNKAARLVYSEADFLPGLVVDYYGGVAVLQTNTAGIDTVLNSLETLFPLVFEEVFGFKLTGMVVRGDSAIRRLEGVSDFCRTSFGDEEHIRNGSFEEGGVRYAVNLLEGQKTGFFLDQKDNRNFLSSWLADKKSAAVLDLFCYSGGWGLRALKMGAERVTFVDESKEALNLVRRGLEANGFSTPNATMVNEDVFSFLEKDNSPYDVVVCDPPAFVKSKKDLPKAKKAYEKLNRLAWRRLKRGGILITCSCSYNLPETDFLDLLNSATGKEGGLARILYRGGQASDHPVLLSMPETRYLKCFALEKMS